MCDLRDAARMYCEFGWRLVPVDGKKPRMFWKSPPSWDQMAPLWDDPETTGLAVILGKLSGNLVVRDFDKPEAFERWKQEYPDLALTLPIVRTGRPEGGYHVYGTMPDAPLLKLSDGELRGNGAIVVLPPSLHPSGLRYEWINPPTGRPALVSCLELNVFSDSASLPSRPKADACIPKQTQVNPSIAYVEQNIRISGCIAKNLPTGVGQRNQCLFHLAQDLLKFLPRDTPFEDLLAIVRKWHSCALPFIQTKDIVESIADFLTAWKRVQWPTGTAWSVIVEEAKRDDFTLGSELEEMDPAARLLRALARHHKGEPFPLSSRLLAQAIGVSCPKTALARLNVFQTMGFIELVKKGEARPGGEATVWRWTGSLD